MSKCSCSAEIPPLKLLLEKVVLALDGWHQWNDSDTLWKTYWEARALLYGFNAAGVPNRPPVTTPKEEE